MSSRIPSEQPPALEGNDITGVWPTLREWLSRLVINANAMINSHEQEVPEIAHPNLTPKGYGGLYWAGDTTPIPLDPVVWNKLVWGAESPDPPGAPFGINPRPESDDIEVTVGAVWMFGYHVSLEFTPGTSFETSLFVNDVKANVFDRVDTSNQSGFTSVAGVGLAFADLGNVADIRVLKLGGNGTEVTMASGEFYAIRVG